MQADHRTSWQSHQDSHRCKYNWCGWPTASALAMLATPCSSTRFSSTWMTLVAHAVYTTCRQRLFVAGVHGAGLGLHRWAHGLQKTRSLAKSQKGEQQAMWQCQAADAALPTRACLLCYDVELPLQAAGSASSARWLLAELGVLKTAPTTLSAWLAHLARFMHGSPCQCPPWLPCRSHSPPHFHTQCPQHQGGLQPASASQLVSPSAGAQSQLAVVDTEAEDVDI